jgi:hypothetical protein
MLVPPFIAPILDLLGLISVDSSRFLDFLVFGFGNGARRRLFLFRLLFKKFLLLFGFSLFFSNYSGRSDGQTLLSSSQEAAATGTRNLSRYASTGFSRIFHTLFGSLRLSSFAYDYLALVIITSVFAWCRPPRRIFR